MLTPLSGLVCHVETASRINKGKKKMMNNKRQDALQLRKVTDVSVKEGACGAHVQQKLMKERKEMKADVVG